MVTTVGHERGGANLRQFTPYPAYKDAGVQWLREIPAHWECLPIKRVAYIRYGLAEPPSELIDRLPFIRATNVARGRIDERDLKMADPDDVPWSRNPTLRTDDDIIVVRSGAYTGTSRPAHRVYTRSMAMPFWEGARAFSWEEFPVRTRSARCVDTMGYLETPRVRFRDGLYRHQ